MRLVYTPEGQDDPQVWTFQLGKLRCHETEGIERRTGMAYGVEFKEKLLGGQVTARRALLWTMLRRTHHTLKFEDVDFADDELTLEFDRDEWQAMYDGLEANVGLDDEERSFRLALIGAEIAKLDAEQAGEDGEGKAPSRSSANAIG
jgi:hypothetical protein